MSNIKDSFFEKIGDVPPVPDGLYSNIISYKREHKIIKSSVAALIIISLIGVFIINSINNDGVEENTLSSSYNDEQFSYIDDIEMDSYSLLNDL